MLHILDSLSIDQDNDWLHPLCLQYFHNPPAFSPQQYLCKLDLGELLVVFFQATEN